MNYLRNFITKAATRRNGDIPTQKHPVVLDCSKVSSIDFTAAKGFGSMIKEFKQREQPFIVYHPHPSVTRTFSEACSDDVSFVIAHTLEELDACIISKCFVKNMLIT